MEPSSREAFLRKYRVKKPKVLAPKETCKSAVKHDSRSDLIGHCSEPHRYNSYARDRERYFTPNRLRFTSAAYQMPARYTGDLGTPTQTELQTQQDITFKEESEGSKQTPSYRELDVGAVFGRSVHCAMMTLSERVDTAIEGLEALIEREVQEAEGRVGNRIQHAMDSLKGRIETLIEVMAKLTICDQPADTGKPWGDAIGRPSTMPSGEEQEDLLTMPPAASVDVLGDGKLFAEEERRDDESCEASTKMDIAESHSQGTSKIATLEGGLIALPAVNVACETDAGLECDSSDESVGSPVDYETLDKATAEGPMC